MSVSLNRFSVFQIVEMGNIRNSTTSLGEAGGFPRLFTVEFREDDPAKCTSAKMVKFRLARSIRPNQIGRGSIVLSPFASEIILNSDRTVALSGGIVVIDCSWVNATSTFKRRMNGTHRRLPVLMAGNPTNYSKLNSFELARGYCRCSIHNGFPRSL